MIPKVNLLTATTVSLFLIASRLGARAAESNDASQKIRVTRIGSQPSRKAPAEHFTGPVRIDPLFQGEDPSHTSASYVTFDMLAKEPDAMKDILKDQPIGRLGRPEEIAAAILWLCSPGASFVIGHGSKGVLVLGCLSWLLSAVVVVWRIKPIIKVSKVVDWMEKVSDEQYCR